MDGQKPAFMFLYNPFLTEYTILMEKYKLQYSEIENMPYDEFLELVNYCCNINELINKKQKLQMNEYSFR